MVFQAAQLEVALNDKNYCISATIDRVLDRGHKQSFYGHSQYIIDRAVDGEKRKCQKIYDFFLNFLEFWSVPNGTLFQGITWKYFDRVKGSNFQSTRRSN